MKHILFFISFLLFNFNISFSQNVEVNSSNFTVGDKTLKGFVACIELDVKTVEKGWSKFLRSVGKFEAVEKQTMQGLNLMLSNVSSDAVDFYSKINVSPRCVQVFMGAFRAGSSLELMDVQNENVKKMLHEFSLEQYRQDVIVQISEAERVVDLAVRAHDKRGSEANSIKSKITRNKKDKIKLYKELGTNELQLKKLRADSTQNFSELETALEEISKVRKIAEEKKLKLNQLK